MPIYENYKYPESACLNIIQTKPDDDFVGTNHIRQDNKIPALEQFRSLVSALVFIRPACSFVMSNFLPISSIVSGEKLSSPKNKTSSSFSLVLKHLMEYLISFLTASETNSESVPESALAKMSRKLWFPSGLNGSSKDTCEPSLLNNSLTVSTSVCNKPASSSCVGFRPCSCSKSEIAL